MSGLKRQKRGIEFWYEFGSTYSYLAAARIEDLARSAGVEVAWRPFLLGPIFAGQGWNDSPFNIYPAKGRYMWQDMERECRRLGLPFRKPSVFPRHSVLAARTATVAERDGWAGSFTRAVFRANFAEDREISDSAVIDEIVARAGYDPPVVRADALADETKGRLRERTAQAEARGVFGAPSFFVADVLFWGNDRLESALAAAAA